MAQRGELLTAGTFTADYRALLAQVLARWGVPSAITCDRWREDDLREALQDVRFPLVPLVIRGMGFKDGAEDVRTFRRACLDGKVRPTRSLLMRSAVSEARVTADAAANWKLAKNSAGGRRMRARDDAAAALILAVAEGDRRADVAGADDFYLGRASEA